MSTTNDRTGNASDNITFNSFNLESFDINNLYRLQSATDVLNMGAPTTLKASTLSGFTRLDIRSLSRLVEGNEKDIEANIDVYVPQRHTLEQIVQAGLNIAKKDEHGRRIRHSEELRNEYVDKLLKQIRVSAVNGLPIIENIENDWDTEIIELHTYDETSTYVDNSLKELRRREFSNDVERAEIIAAINTRLREKMYLLSMHDRNLKYSNAYRTSELVSRNAMTLLPYAMASEQQTKNKMSTCTLQDYVAMTADRNVLRLSKTQLPLILFHGAGYRSKNEAEMYRTWTGMQVFDIDLKNSDIMQQFKADARERVEDKISLDSMSDENIEALISIQLTDVVAVFKQQVFEILKQYSWFVGIKQSRSGKGLHVVTKVTPMYSLYDDETAEGEFANTHIHKFWYQFSYVHKYSVIAYVLKSLGVEDVYKNDVFDSSNAKIQQGIAINYDVSAMWNDSFIDEYPILSAPEVHRGANMHEMFINNANVNENFKAWFEDWKAISELLQPTDDAVAKTALQRKLEKTKTYQTDWIFDEDSLEKQIDDALNKLQVVYKQKAEDKIKGNKHTNRYVIMGAFASLFKCKDEKRFIAANFARRLLDIIGSDGRGLTEQQVLSAFNNPEKAFANRWVINLLKRGGLQIDEKKKREPKSNKARLNRQKEDTLQNVAAMLRNESYIFGVDANHHTIELQPGQYIGHANDKLLSLLSSNKINVIESAPNTGKTEWVKSLAASGKRVALVLPYTSTIDSKIVNDKSIIEHFDVYYKTHKYKTVGNATEGSKSARKSFIVTSVDSIDVEETVYTNISMIGTGESLTGCIRPSTTINAKATPVTQKRKTSAVFTLDKFSQLSEADLVNFDYVVVDESHLLFTSSYRSTVTSKTVDLIKQTVLNKYTTWSKLQHSKNAEEATQAIYSVLNTAKNEDDAETVKNIAVLNTKFIMMTGTVTADIDYWTQYGMLRHIRVDKQHQYEKHFDLTLTKTRGEAVNLMQNRIADAIKEGKKVIVPSNRGYKHFKAISSFVEKELGRKVEAKYYKRANADESFMQHINKDCTLHTTELLFCSDYLSVGIDIKDTDEFEVIYMSGDFGAEDIEQFNNRLRSTNIHCKMYANVLNDDGTIKQNVLDTKYVDYSTKAEYFDEIADDNVAAKLQARKPGNGKRSIIIDDIHMHYRKKDAYNNDVHSVVAFELQKYEEQFKQISKSLMYIVTAMSKRFNYDVTIHTASVAKKVVEQHDAKMLAIKTAVNADETVAVFELVSLFSKPEHWKHVKHFTKNDKKRYFKFDETIDPAVNAPLSEKFIVREVVNEKENKDDENSTNSTYGEKQTYVAYGHLHKPFVDTCIKLTQMLRPFYSIKTIHKIIMLCMSSSTFKINHAELNRVIELFKLLHLDTSDEMSIVTKQIIHDVFKHVFDYMHFEEKTLQLHRDKATYDQEVNFRLILLIDSVIKHITSDKLLSEKRKKYIQDKITSLMKTLFVVKNTTIGRGKNKKQEIRMTMRIMYEFDNPELFTSYVFNQRSKNFFPKTSKSEYEQKRETAIVPYNALHYQYFTPFWVDNNSYLDAKISAVYAIHEHIFENIESLRDENISEYAKDFEEIAKSMQKQHIDEGLSQLDNDVLKFRQTYGYYAFEQDKYIEEYCHIEPLNPQIIRKRIDREYKNYDPNDVVYEEEPDDDDDFDVDIEERYYSNESIDDGWDVFKHQ